MDSTHREVFDAARRLGAVTVEITTPKTRQSKGQPDGYVYHPRIGWQAIQVKGPHTKISEKQLELARVAPVHLMRTQDDMVKLINDDEH